MAIHTVKPAVSRPPTMHSDLPASAAASAAVLMLQKATNGPNTPNGTNSAHPTNGSNNDQQSQNMADHHTDVVKRLGNYLTLINGTASQRAPSPPVRKSSLVKHPKTSPGNGSGSAKFVGINFKNSLSRRSKRQSANGTYSPVNGLDCNRNDISSSTGSSDTDDLASERPRIVTKRVTFADTNGLDLASIKVITEGRDTPPYLSPSFLESLVERASATSKPAGPLLTLNFPSPLSDYVAFQSRLFEQKVCLESITLNEFTLIATIKVMNLAFEKQVFIRYSDDEWETSSDADSYYINTVSSPTSPMVSTQPKNRFDTFSTQVELQKRDPLRPIEFAIAFVCCEDVHWDNNNGSNYQIVPEGWTPSTPKEEAVAAPPKSDVLDTTPVSLSLNDSLAQRRTLFRRRGRQNSTEFAIWREVDESVPYW